MWSRWRRLQNGQWLLALIYTTQGTAQITVYGINQTSGLLTAQSSINPTFTGTLGKLSPSQIRISPSAAYVAACMGAAGDVLFSFNTAANYGVLTQLETIPPTTQTSTGFINSDNSIAFSTNSAYLFVGTTSSGNSFISTYPIGSTGVLGTGSPIASGNAPKSLEMDSSGTYLYSANFSDGTISGYSLANGALTSLGTAFPASAGVTALVRDKSGDYIISVASTSGASGTDDVTLYGFNTFSAGQLQEVAVSASGSDPAGSIAVGATH